MTTIMVTSSPLISATHANRREVNLPQDPPTKGLGERYGGIEGDKRRFLRSLGYLREKVRVFTNPKLFRGDQDSEHHDSEGEEEHSMESEEEVEDVPVPTFESLARPNHPAPADHLQPSDMTIRPPMQKFVSFSAAGAHH
mgnify:FL=1